MTIRKNILITGASSGLGAGMARQYAEMAGGGVSLILRFVLAEKIASISSPVNLLRSIPTSPLLPVS